MVELVAPELRAYRGCLILADRFDKSNVDDWLKSVGGDITAVEEVVNHVHLWDVVDGGSPDLDDLGRRIAQTWRDVFAARYPEHRITVTFATEPDEYGPTISCHQAAFCSEC